MSLLQPASLDEARDAFLQYSPIVPGKERHYSLDRMRRLMEGLGNPQDELRVVHIAGTSGKTSTAYFIRALLEQAGARTGLTVSPHIVAINERVQIAGVPLEEKRYLAYVAEFFATIASLNLKPSYVELLIALAYRVFAKEKVDYAVIETSIGGLLDSTNVATNPSKICVITTIGLDHTALLGNTVEEITAQKAGIIHEGGNTVFAIWQLQKVIDIIANVAKEKRAAFGAVKPFDDVPPNLPSFQAGNWSLACEVFDFIQARDDLPVLSTEQYNAAALQTPPGRWEKLTVGGKTIILDGAHNPQKMQALATSLVEEGLAPMPILVNILADKGKQTLEVLRSVVSHAIVPEFLTEGSVKFKQSAPAQDTARIFKEMGIDTELPANLEAAIEALLARPEKTVVVTGSLYMVSEVRALLLGR